MYVTGRFCTCRSLRISSIGNTFHPSNVTKDSRYRLVPGYSVDDFRSRNEYVQNRNCSLPDGVSYLTFQICSSCDIYSRFSKIQLKYLRYYSKYFKFIKCKRIQLKTLWWGINLTFYIYINNKKNWKKK